MNECIIFDKETTGLVVNRLRTIDKQPWTVEDFFLKIDLDTREELGTYHSYYKPGVRMEKEAEKVTGLTDEFLADKPMYEEKVHEVKAFFDTSKVIVGQNVMFDITVMGIDFERCGLKFEYQDKIIIDLLEATEFIKGHRMKLGDMYEHFFKERFSGSHEAEADVRATARIYLQLLEMGYV